MADTEYFINPEDPRILLGDYNFTDAFFTIDETYITPVVDGYKAPVDHINSDLSDFKNILIVGHINARSVPKHIDEITLLFQNSCLDAIGVSETFIKKHTPKSLCKIPGFKFLRKD